MKIGLKLKMLRLERQVKKKDLANLYGCHTVSISKFEKSDSLNTDTIKKYCSCLGLDYDLVFIEKQKE